MTKRLTTEEFIKKAKEVHKDVNYDYSKVVYKNNKTPVIIIDPMFGEFEQTPMKHLAGHDCPKRRYLKTSEKLSLSKEEFIKQAREIHGDKYDYSKVEYVNNHTKICIICPEHGEFWQTPNNHISKLRHRGCHFCGGSDNLNINEFIEKSNKIHKNEYDYSKANYVNHMTKVCIICHKKDKYGNEHGEFWQTPNSHLRGSGCPKCNKLSRIRYIEYLLRENDIDFVCEKTFDWLKYKKSLRLDIFLEKYNIAIEHQGKQHFEPIYYWFKDKERAEHLLSGNQMRDKIKHDLCKEHNIKIFYINYNDNIEDKIKQIVNEIDKSNNK